MSVWKNLAAKIATTPIWLMAPSLVIVAAIGATMAGYNPLIFDPSLYQSQSALASELTQVDADALEAGSGESVGSGAVAGKLNDGTWTGYAPCGEGNTDDWKPYYVSVTIEVKDGKVAGISDISGSSTGNDGQATLSWDAAENQKYLDQAIEGHGGSGVKAQMLSQIEAQGAVTGVDTVSGATYSAVAIYNAYVDAVGKAGGNASSVASPVASSAAGTSKSVKAKASANSYADGNWTGYAACGKGNSDDWKPYYVAVTVKVKGGKVSGITKIAGSSTGESGSAKLAWDASENQKYLDWAIGGHNGVTGLKAQVNSQLSKKGAVTSVDTVSGATYSSEAIYEAYAAALDKAAKAAGSKAKQKKAKRSTTKSDTGSCSKVSAGDSAVSGSLADGLWQGYAICGEGNDEDWKPYYVTLTVKVSGGKAVSVSDVQGCSTGDSGSRALSWDASENQSYLDWAADGRTRSGVSYTGVLQQIRNSLAAGTTPSSIDTVSGATYSSKSLFQAFYAALRKSAAAAGSTVDTPESPDSSSGGNGSGSGEGDAPASADSKADNPQDSLSAEEIEAARLAKTGVPSIHGNFPDGSWLGYALCGAGNGDGWGAYYIGVEITTQNGSVVSINDVFGDEEGVVDNRYIYNRKENASYLNWAINGKGVSKGIKTRIQNRLNSGSEIENIDTISNATYSCRAIYKAFADAIEKASGN